MPLRPVIYMYIYISCALMALVLPAVLEEHMTLERVFASESSPALANVGLCVVMDILVSF
jgi:hypothetical protein